MNPCCIYIHRCMWESIASLEFLCIAERRDDIPELANQN